MVALLTGVLVAKGGDGLLVPRAVYQFGCRGTRCARPGLSRVAQVLEPQIRSPDCPARPFPNAVHGTGCQGRVADAGEQWGSRFRANEVTKVKRELYQDVLHGNGGPIPCRLRPRRGIPRQQRLRLRPSAQGQRSQQAWQARPAPVRLVCPECRLRPPTRKGARHEIEQGDHRKAGRAARMASSLGSIAEASLNLGCFQLG
jgi:hypothetical protein